VISVEFILRQYYYLDDQEMMLMELKAGDRVQVASYDSDPHEQTVRVSYEVAEVKYVGRRSVTVEYITGPLAGTKSTVMANTLKKLEGIIDMLAATGEAGDTTITSWESYDHPGEPDA
jgi:hypothetical protein